MKIEYKLLIITIVIVILSAVIGYTQINNINETQKNYDKEKLTLDELENITSYDNEVVSMSLVRANLINRNITTIYDKGNDTIVVNIEFVDFEGGITHNTKLILIKSGILHESTNAIEFIKTGYLCKKGMK